MACSLPLMRSLRKSLPCPLYLKFHIHTYIQQIISSFLASFFSPKRVLLSNNVFLFILCFLFLFLVYFLLLEWRYFCLFCSLLCSWCLEQFLTHDIGAKELYLRLSSGITFLFAWNTSLKKEILNLGCTFESLGELLKILKPRPHLRSIDSESLECAQALRVLTLSGVCNEKPSRTIAVLEFPVGSLLVTNLLGFCLKVFI